MLITKEELKQAKKETRELTKGTPYVRRFSRLKKIIKNDISGRIFIYRDICPEFYEKEFYVMEVREAYGYIYFFSVKPTVEELIKDLEDFLYD